MNIELELDMVSEFQSISAKIMSNPNNIYLVEVNNENTRNLWNLYKTCSIYKVIHVRSTVLIDDF